MIGRKSRLQQLHFELNILSFSRNAVFVCVCNLITILHIETQKDILAEAQPQFTNGFDKCIILPLLTRAYCTLLLGIAAVVCFSILYGSTALV